MDARAAITDAEELRRIGPILLLTIATFFVHRPLGLEPATVALIGASAMLAASRQRVDRTLAGIDWSTLFFFIGLFVIVGALERRARSASWPTRSSTYRRLGPPWSSRSRGCRRSSA